MGHHRENQRIWPTLLAAATEAAVRAAAKQGGHVSTDIFTAVILSRTSFDAYLHELLLLRHLSPYVEFATGTDARKIISETRWRIIRQHKKSLANLSKQERTPFSDVRELPFTEKLQTILLLLDADAKSPLTKHFEKTFRPMLNLNTLRNAIVHHNFQAPSKHLKRICEGLCRTLGLVVPTAGLPWENFLLNPELATWSCKVAAKTLLTIEAIDYQRAIHFSATDDVVRSALSPLKL